MGLLAISVLPTPSYAQYFVFVAPALAMLAPTAFARSGRPGNVFGLVTLAVYVGLAVPGVREKVIRGRLGPWDSSVHRPGNVDAVGRKLCEHAPDHGAIAAHWPAYLVVCADPVLPAARNQFSRAVAGYFSPLKRRELDLHADSELVDAVSDGRIGGFVLGRFGEPFFDQLRAVMQSRQWRKEAALFDAEVWVAPARGVACPD